MTGAFGWKGQPESGVEEKWLGSRGDEKAADEVEVMTNARGALFNSSKQGVDADDMKREGDATKEEMLQHGIRGMENFGKWSPRWNRREDFGIKDTEEFTTGIHNLDV